MVVRRLVHVGTGVFVFNLFTYHHLGLVGISGHKARKGHLRQVITRNIGIAVVGDAVAIVVGVEGVFRRDAHTHIAVVVAKEQHCHGWDIPSVVCIVEVGLHLVGVGATHVA